MGEQVNLFGGAAAGDPQRERGADEATASAITPAEGRREEPRAMSVAEFNGRVESILKGLFPGAFRIQGFVSGWSRSYARDGHVYFDLYDKDPEDDSRQLAKIGMVLWRGTRRRIESQIRELAGANGELDDLQVYFEVSVNYWVQGGRLSLVVEGIDLEASLGAQKLDRERILRRLDEEGLLQRNGLLPLPAVPLRLGLITSIESAAYHDFVKELRQAGIAFHLYCRDARVQGGEQEESLQEAFRLFAANPAAVDALVLIRGGGSRSDLMGFDSEALARTIAACPLPVLTGIGHEIDRSIADEVAHRAFKTPTAVAQYLVQRTEEYLASQEEKARDIRDAARRSLQIAVRDLERMARRLSAAGSVRMGRARERLARLAASIPVSARQPLRLARLQLLRRADRIGTSPREKLSRALRETEYRAERLRLLDPFQVMKRGFSLTLDADGRVLRSAAGINAGDLIRSRLSAGELTSRVESALPGGDEQESKGSRRSDEPEKE